MAPPHRPLARCLQPGETLRQPGRHASCFHVSGVTHLWFPQGDRSPAARGSLGQGSLLPNAICPLLGPVDGHYRRDNGVKRCLGSNALRQPRIGAEFRVPRRGKGHEGREWGNAERLNCPSGFLPACSAPPLWLFQELGAWRLEGILSLPASLAHLCLPAGMKGVGKGELTVGNSSALSPSVPILGQTSALHTP